MTAPKGHRPRGGHLEFGPRIVVARGRVTRSMHQMLCDRCGEPVRFKATGYGTGRWVHGPEAGIVAEGTPEK